MIFEMLNAPTVDMRHTLVVEALDMLPGQAVGLDRR